MYAARFMSKQELRTLQSGAQVEDNPKYRFDRIWDTRNKEGKEGNYCFFSLDSVDDIMTNIGLIYRDNYKVEGKVLVIVKIKALSHTRKYRAAYNGSWIHFPGDCGWNGCDTSLEFNITCYSKENVKIISISNPKNPKDACYCMFNAMKKKGVIRKEITFKRFLRDADRNQERNYKFVSIPFDDDWD